MNRVTQQGAVLIVSLVMLLLMTILGLTAMSSATMEQKMAANSQDLNITLQASESATRAVYEDINVLGEALNSSTPVERTVTLSNAIITVVDPLSGVATSVIGPEDTVTSSASVQYIGQSPVSGFSLGVNKTNFAAYHFAVTGTGTMSNKINTVTAQGVYRVAPSR